MSETDRACDLLADLLKDGPRDAAEVLAAAKLANVSGRTMQRAANMLQVVKTRLAFRGPWLWRLPDDGDETETPSTAKESDPEKSAAPVSANTGISRISAARAETIAARLRMFETGRGKAAPIHAGDPRLMGWVRAGITDPDLREAYELAVFALVQQRKPEPITVGMLAPFVEKLIGEVA